MLPYELRKLIEEALKSVRCHPQHDLNLGHRQAIWAALGPSRHTQKTMGNEGHKRRVLLAVLAVRHVLPIWHQVWPDDQTPPRILAYVSQVMKGKMSQKAALRDIDRFWEYIDLLGSQTKNMAAAVGFAAVQALTTAVVDEFFDPDEIELNLTDSEEFESNDASFHAAVAYANGPIWEIDASPAPNSEKRQQFWEWWLTEAVPKSWKSISPKRAGSDGWHVQGEPHLLSAAKDLPTVALPQRPR